MNTLASHIIGADQSVFRLVNEAWTNPLFDWLMPALSRVGNDGAAWFVLLAALAAFGKRTGRRMALAGLLAFAIGFFGSETLKELTMRPRPLPALADVRLLVPEPNSFAFPSGHTTSAFSVAAAVALSARRLLGRVPLWGWGMLALAAGISYSRIYVGVHWPSDVVAGVLFGAFGGWTGARLATRREGFGFPGPSPEEPKVQCAAQGEGR